MVSTPIEATAPEAALPAPVGLPTLLLTFIRLGTLTFGGSVQAWVHREVVTRRGWIDDQAFLSGLAVAQVLPGANPVNIALYVGLRLRGGLGAAICVLGMVVPAFCVILVLAALYRAFGQVPAVHFVLTGLAASGVGATLAMGLRVARRLPRTVMAPAVATAVFAAVGLMHWPMLPVVALAVPLSVAWCYRQEKAARRD
ncbi:MAG TPA: chromate transporter [Magnetospirillaceae bacterium]|nr:chromate transporter [Magnetospirillaceae bacterium]